MDKLRALTVFRRIVELGSFQAAAKDLRLSKAAVTKNINELEIALETPLSIEPRESFMSLNLGKIITVKCASH